jgi:hypothetical protein
VARRALVRQSLWRINNIRAGNGTLAARRPGRNPTVYYRLLARKAIHPAMFKTKVAAES